jgi:plastocyanin
MQSLTEALRAVEGGLASSSWAEVSKSVAALESAARELEQFGADEDSERGPRLESGAAVLAGLCRELLVLPEAQRAQSGSVVLSEIRQACVTCHAKLRPDDPERGEYPARRNTIAGAVEVRTLAGELREDRSGVLVFLEGVPMSAPAPLPRQNPVISQADRRFEPKVLPVLQGTTIDFPNDDLIFHNVFSLSKTQPFDLGVYKPGDSKSLTFPQAGLVKVYCNMHPQMISNIIVLENPCFALTDEAGAFVIGDVPDGTYNLRTWHELGGDSITAVSVSGSSLLRLSLSVAEDRATLGHKNKFGLPYRDKY